MINEVFPILSTGDLPRMLAFYQGLLGFVECDRFPAVGAPKYVELRCGEGASAGKLGLDQDTTSVFGGEQRLELCVLAKDCEALVEHLRAGGSTIVAEPQQMPWGGKAAHIEDPDGNRLVILSRPESG